MFKIADFFPRLAARSSVLWAFFLAVSATSVAQQITCPVANPATNTSATATNSVNPCTIQALAIYTNASTGTLTNEAGGNLVNDGGLANNGKLLNDASATLTNNAALSNSPGATLSNSGVLVGTGAIQNAGTLNNLGSGSIINVINSLGGTINNSGLSVYLASGSDIQGGTLKSGSGSITAWGNNVTLDGSSSYGALTIQGTVGNDATIYTMTNFEGTINNEGKIVLSNAFGGVANVSLAGNTTLEGGGTITLDGGSIQNGPGSLTNVNNTIQGDGSLTPGNVTFNNHGTINANVSEGAIQLFALPLNNTGVMEATHGGLLVQIEGTINNNSGGSIISDATSYLETGDLNNNAGATISNAGSFKNDGLLNNNSGATISSTGYFENDDLVNNNAGGKISNSNLFANQGTFNNNVGATLTNSDILNDGGLIQNYGTLNNTGGVLDILKEIDNVAGGTINNGAASTITAGPHGVIVNNGSINTAGFLTLQPDGIMVQSATGVTTNSGMLQINGSAELLNYGSIINNKGATLINDGSFINEAGSLFVNNGTFTLGAGSTFENAGSFTNAGTVNVDPGATLSNPSGYVQHGGQTVVDGTLNSMSVKIQGGTFSGAGTVTGSVLNSGGIIQPGGNGAPGTLVVQGYEQQSGATFDELIGASGNGSLVAGSGGIELDAGSLLDIDLLNGFNPTDGETFDIMGANQMSGTFANAPTTGFQMDGFNWTIAYDDPGEIVLDAVSPVNSGGGTTNAPEPSTFLVLVPSLAALAFLRRRTTGLPV